MYLREKNERIANQRYKSKKLTNLLVSPETIVTERNRMVQESQNHKLFKRIVGTL